MIKKLFASFTTAKNHWSAWRMRSKKWNAQRTKYKKQIHVLVRLRGEAYAEFVEAKENLDRELAKKKPNSTYVKRLRTILRKKHVRFDEIMSQLEIAKSKRNKAYATLKRSNAKLRFWTKKKTIYRKKLKAAKAKANPVYESWMANGYDDNITDGAKKFVAIGVVKFGCTVTSLRRTYVPAGGSPTSWHLTDPGRAADLAGARMGRFQAYMYKGHQGDANCLELFGPVNDKCLKYGSAMVLIEGDALETLHDSHVHGAFN